MRKTSTHTFRLLRWVQTNIAKLPFLGKLMQQVVAVLRLYFNSWSICVFVHDKVLKQFDTV